METDYSNITPDTANPTDAIVETDADMEKRRKDALAGWINTRIQEWENFRKQRFDDKWREYYRIWRGIWKKEDSTRETERSKIIAPASQQAVEMLASEFEEAIFGKGKFFEVADDVADENKDSFDEIYSKLKEDYDLVNIQTPANEVLLNSCVYGTGIAKILVDEIDVPSVGEEEVSEILPDGSVGSFSAAVSTTTRKFVVKLEAVSPFNFVIDTAARTIDEALGCAHITNKPRHWVIEQQVLGNYYNAPIRDISTDTELFADNSQVDSNATGHVKICEYHGLVPVNLLPAGERDEKVDDLGLVEAIVTIANDGVILKEVANPLLHSDRAFMAFQLDTIPNQFWGRGVVEKAYNIQKTLDAELRARMDGLALTVHPMMAGDVTRLPRGTNLNVRPGRQVLTNGNPKEVLMPFNFGSIDSNTFANAADLERMISVATGAMDTAAPTSVNERNKTASGMSMMLSGMIKRSKRNMQNIDKNFLTPFVRKSLWRYMQFDPARYPVRDYKFKVTSTMGMMAREFEHSQLVQLLQTVPPASPAYWMVLRSIFENSSVTNKEMMVQIIDQMIEQSMNPQPPQPDIDQQINMAKVEENTRHNQESEQIERDRIEAQFAMDLIK